MDIYIAGAARTPIGSFQGELSSYSATKLGSVAIQAAIERSAIPLDAVQSVMMGCVLPAGLGQAPARQAAIGAGLSIHAECTTINKVCGSGMKSVILAHDAIKAGTADIIVAGGMESMSNAPYFLSKARKGYRIGHQRLMDHLLFDGLEDAYQPGQLMGNFAENCAQKYHFSREEQDQYTIESFTRAMKATQQGKFASEIIAIGEIREDECPKHGKLEKIKFLKPSFKTDGTITAASSSSISDGAAALVISSSQTNIKPLARIVAHSTHAQEPEWFTTAPISAINSLLKKTGWSMDDVDLFEINEAFAVVTLAAMKTLKIPHEKLNIYGGACALGHPLGATGARIIVTLIHALVQNNLKRGIAALCIGGGEATAIAIERL